MKIQLIGACAVALLTSGTVHAQVDQVCYDQRGANVERTRDMFGQYAAQDVQRRLGKKDDWGTKKFTLSNGVKDKGEGERSTKITKHLFQAPAPQPR